MEKIIENDLENSFNDYVNLIYDYTLIESLVFALDTKLYIDKLGIDNLDKTKLLYNFQEYLQENKDENIFDDTLKNKYYYLLDYINDRSNKEERLVQNEIVRDIKIALNNIGNNNFDFLKEQILLREYSIRNYSYNWFVINRISNQTILENKEIYYDSISKDFLFLNLLLMDETEFRDNYQKYLLNINFYRSMNYFLAIYNWLFKKPEILDKAKFIIYNDELLIKNSKYNSQEIDQNLSSILNVTKKMVKKVEKSNR